MGESPTPLNLKTTSHPTNFIPPHKLGSYLPTNVTEQKMHHQPLTLTHILISPVSLDRAHLPRCHGASGAHLGFGPPPHSGHLQYQSSMGTSSPNRLLFYSLPPLPHPASSPDLLQSRKLMGASFPGYPPPPGHLLSHILPPISITGRCPLS
jgi:hypothetical protein